MGEGAEPEVKIKLTVDSDAKEKTEELKQGIHQSGEEAKHLKEGGEGVGRELLKASLYTEALKATATLVGEGFHQAWEMAEGFAEAASEAADEGERQVRAMTGLMSFMDRGEHGMQEIKEYAAETKEELERAGEAAGVASNTMIDMYDKVIERGNRSTEEAKELVDQMAVVGKVVPGGMEGLAQGFNMMELGIVRARNPLVQIIASTGLLKGNAHDVAKAMQKMTPAEQIEVANKAIAKQAELLKAGGAFSLPTMQELKTSFNDFREQALESVGQPLLAHLIPQLTRLRQFLLDNSEAIFSYAAKIGERLGQVVDTVTGLIGEVYDGTVKNWGEIKSTYEEAVKMWEDAWAIAGVKSSDIHKDLHEMSLTIVSAFKTISQYIKAYFEVGAGLLDLVHGRAYGTTTNQVRADQEGKRVAEAADVYGPGSTSALDEQIAKYRAAAEAADMDAAQVDRVAEAMREHHDAAMEQADALKGKVEGQDFDYVSRYIDQAMKAGNDAAEAFALNTIAESDSATRALITGAIHVDGGLAALQGVIDDKAPELAKKMKALSNSLMGVGIKGQGPSVNFYGANINIKQDFRDEDPDRIMQVFKRDLGNAAIARRQARTGGFAGL